MCLKLKAKFKRGALHLKGYPEGEISIGIETGDDGILKILFKDIGLLTPLNPLFIHVNHMHFPCISLAFVLIRPDPSPLCTNSKLKQNVTDELFYIIQGQIRTP